MKRILFLFSLLFFANVTRSSETKLDGMSIYLLGEFILTSQGEVKNLNITSSKYPGIDKDLLRAVSSWKYHPFMIDGVAVDVPVELDVRLDATFKLNGEVERLQIASVRTDVKGELSKKTSSPIPNIFVRYPTQFKSNVEANVMLVYEVSDDGLVQQVGVQSLRLFPVGRIGLSDKRLEFAIKEFSNAALSNRVGQKIDLSKMKSDFKCAPNCPKIAQMVFFNLPPGNRFRSWRGYHDAHVPPLKWLKPDELVYEPQQIELIDPSQANIVL